MPRRRLNTGKCLEPGCQRAAYTAGRCQSCYSSIRRRAQNYLAQQAKAATFALAKVIKPTKAIKVPPRPRYEPFPEDDHRSEYYRPALPIKIVRRSDMRIPTCIDVSSFPIPSL